MDFARLQRYAQKIYALGPHKTLQIVHQRSLAHLFKLYWRRQAQKKKAAISWSQFCKYYQLPDDGKTFLKELKKNNSLSLHDVVPTTVTPEVVITQAQFFMQKKIDLLGSGVVTRTKKSWHQDIRLDHTDQSADAMFDAHTYFEDIQIMQTAGGSLGKDIKLPWELSRCQHLLVLGHAHRLTDDQEYAKAVIAEITEWIDQNPFLLGVNWKCPMDVGIRAINWVWAFSLIKDSKSMSSTFTKKLVTSLADHLNYLEHNWELYDGRTSNHYLSDLVGYLYLCYFFRGLPGIQKKTDWVVGAIVQELDKQVFDEGTDYEGSTAYHRLVTELLYHADLVATQCGIVLPEKSLEKINAMIDFIDWCTPSNGRLITVGDDDSGKILYYGYVRNLRGRTKISLEHGLKKFSQFGISIIKTKQFHLSMRHHAYNRRQPSGHFHNDALSITLSYNGVAIITDPGSYVYTPSVAWRNFFRSISVHNTFYIKNNEPIALDDRLFALDIPDSAAMTTIKPINGGYSLWSQHDLYAASHGLRAHRRIDVNTTTGVIVMIDSWELLGKVVPRTLEWCWNFTLDPAVAATRYGDKIILKHDGNHVAQIESEQFYNIVDGFVAPEYGRLVPSQRLVATMPLDVEKNIVTIIRKI